MQAEWIDGTRGHSLFIGRICVGYYTEMPEGYVVKDHIVGTTDRYKTVEAARAHLEEWLY